MQASFYKLNIFHLVFDLRNPITKCFYILLMFQINSYGFKEGELRLP